MKSVGLDIATCTGMALVGDGDDRGKTIYLSDERGFSRLQLIAINVEGTLKVWQPDVVVIESYAYSKNINSFITLVELGTVVRQVLYQMHWSWVDVNPTALKKWTTGKGNAKKEQMAEAAQERWNYTSKSHDIIDAIALAHMGQLGYEVLRSIPGVFYQHR